MIAPPVPHRDIAADIAGEAEARAERAPEAVSVLVASRDPALIAEAGPRLAAELYPGRTFGRVLYHEPHPDPGWVAFSAEAGRTRGRWSEVAVQEIAP